MNSMTTRALVKLVIFSLTLLLTGCGYYNPYAAQGHHPISVQRSMWENHTTEIGLDNTIFQAQSDWLRKSPLIHLVGDADGAGLTITGSIDRVTYPEISFGAYRTGIEGRAELTVSFAITDHQSGQVTWQQKGVTRQQSFFMSQDPLKLQANRKAALQQIADDFAEDIYLHLINTMMRPSS